MPWPASMVATGDLITAAQLNQLPIALAKIDTSGGTAIDFTAIPQFWTHLMIVAALQTSSGGTADAIKLTFNGDNSASYNWQRLRGSNTVVDALGAAAATFINAGEIPGKAAGGFGCVTILLQNYALAQPHSICSSGYTCADIASVGSQNSFEYGGVWKPATPAAVNRVTLTSAAYVAGSVAMLYGMGAF